MYYSATKHKAAIAMPDSDSKLGKLELIGMSLGLFDKRSIINECHRLRDAGFKSPAQRYAERIANK